MVTFLEIQNKVKTRLIDTPSQIVGEIPSLVNLAIRELERLHNFKVMETRGVQVVSVAGDRAIATLPEDFKEWRGKPFLITNLGTIRDLVWAADINGPQDAFNDQDEGQPQVLLHAEEDDNGSSQIQVWPLPDGLSDYSDGEYRLYMPYYRFLPDLVSNSDTNWFTVNAEEFITRKAAAEGFWLDWDEQRATAWEARTAQKEKEAIQADKRFRLGGVTTFVPYPNGVNAPNIRW